MSYFQLLPSADESGKETLHAWWENGFSDDEISEIIKVGEGKVLGDASVGFDQEGRVDSSIRRSRVGWISQPELPWLYERMGWIARKLNGEFFNYDITGFNEDLQYTVYQSTNEGYYDWHMDKGYSSNGAPPRKLSMVLLLSDPEEYEGGDLELMTGNTYDTASKTKGMVHVFPSFLIHRVTPVVKGTRRSLVVWLCGPRWK